MEKSDQFFQKILSVIDRLVLPFLRLSSNFRAGPDRAQHRVLLALLSGATIVLAFPKWGFWPAIFLAPIFLNALCLNCETFWAGFRYGFLASVVVMLGGFYWVTHVIHEFGRFSWPLSYLIYVGFCGIGALNFPIFCGAIVSLHKYLRIEFQSSRFVHLWFSLGIPAVYTLVEYAVPKLFPWAFGHCFHSLLSVIQISEITGVTFLTFLIYSTGSTVGLLLFLYLPAFGSADESVPPLDGAEIIHPKIKILAIPVFLWAMTLLFGSVKLHRTDIGDANRRALRVSLIQANIGSLDKVDARAGISGKVQHIVDTYHTISDAAVHRGLPPELIVWPETAMPFFIDSYGSRLSDLEHWILEWNIPLLTGGYAVGKTAGEDYNAAVLLQPKEGEIDRQIYRKNVLLAFGETMPFGEWVPQLYKWFPQVAHFGRGEEQNILTLSNGIRLGVTICYEGILPNYVRKIGKQNIHALINLTNDSWYGNTSEPFQHGALSVFRAVELRVPLVRVTNTGISFAVTEWGEIETDQDGEPKRLMIGEQGSLDTEIWVNQSPKKTFYLLFGDWFVGVAFLICAFVLVKRRRHVPVSV